MAGRDYILGYCVCVPHVDHVYHFFLELTFYFSRRQLRQDNVFQLYEKAKSNLDNCYYSAGIYNVIISPKIAHEYFCGESRSLHITLPL
jgi:uncharacterized membrane protein